jgi:hypothetical protein
MRREADDGDVERNGWTPHGHCTIFFCDIVGFGSRPDGVQTRLREVMYAALRAGFAAARLPLETCYQEDRGDGVIVVLPPTADPASLVHPLPDHLRGALRTHNGLAAPQAQMRLRVALHAGQLASDDNGLVGTTINHAARLLDAPAFKQAIEETTAPLGVLASDEFYHAVIEPGIGAVDPDEFRPIEIRLKETRTTGWLCIREPTRRPPHGTHGDAAVSSSLAHAQGSRDPATQADPDPDPDPDPGPSNEPSSRPPIFVIVDQLMGIPLLTTAEGREDLVAALRPEIAIRIPRRSRAQHDVFSIVGTCLEFSHGMEELLAVVRELTGDTAHIRALEETVAELRRRRPY